MTSLLLFFLAQELSEKQLPSLPDHELLSKVVRIAKIEDFKLAVEAWHDGTVKFRVNGKECRREDLDKVIEGLVRSEDLFGKYPTLPAEPRPEILTVQMDRAGEWRAGRKTASDFDSFLTSLDLGKCGRVELAIAPDAPWREGIKVLYAAELLGIEKGKAIPLHLWHPKEMPKLGSQGSLKEKALPKSPSPARLDEGCFPAIPKEKGDRYRRLQVLVSIAENVDTQAFQLILERLIAHKLVQISVRVDLGLSECTVLPFRHVILASYLWVDGRKYAEELHREVLRCIKVGNVTILDLASEEYMQERGRAALRAMGYEFPDDARITDSEKKLFDDDIEKYQPMWIDLVNKE